MSPTKRTPLAWFLGASLLAACGGGAKTAPPPAEPTPAPVAETPPPAPPPEAAKPAPPPPTLEETEQKTLEALRACHQSMAAKDWDKLAACFTDDAVSGIADSPQKSTGGKEASQMLAGVFAAFPDFNPRPQLVLVNGSHVATVVVATGTNDGAFMGMPATHKKIGVYGLRVLELAGDKIKSDMHYTDLATWMGQLGALKMPHRAPAEPAAGKPTVVLAKDDKAEADNVAVVGKMCEAFNKHDVPAISALFADDAVVHDMTGPADTTGKKDIEKMLTWLFKGLPDMAGTCQSWGAGDYVVNLVAWTATNKGAMPPMLKKATNKSLGIHDGEIYQLAGGKITHYWRFSNGMAMAMQLGLGPKPPKAPKPSKKTP